MGVPVKLAGVLSTGQANFQAASFPFSLFNPIFRADAREKNMDWSGQP
jgi:hypothetical protein